MQCMYQFPKLRRCICTAAVGCLRCKIIAGNIPPVINLFHRLYTFRFDQIFSVTFPLKVIRQYRFLWDHLFLKLVGRHQLYGRNAKFFQIWDFICNRSECPPFFSRTGCILHGKSPHMQFIHNHLLPFNLRLSVVFPVKCLRICTTTDKIILLTAGFVIPFFPADNTGCIGIRNDFSVYLIIVS